MECICCKSGEGQGFKSPIRPADPAISAVKMFSKVRRQRRPLGQFSPESRVELQLEKAMFRQNAQVLRDMCDLKQRQKRREAQQHLSIDQFTRQLKYEKSSMDHYQERQSQVTSINKASNITPEVRWLLTRSARLQRANNAGFSKYSKPVRDRVVSANGRRGVNAMSLERQRSVCSRESGREYDRSTMQKCQCDILGPSFCSDCTKITRKVQLMREQEYNFPRLEVHTRSLVAPERVERMYLVHPKELFDQKKRYACGCPVSAELEITTPLVYTPHEIFERIRRKKNIELGNELIKREQELSAKQMRTNTPVQQQYLEHDDQDHGQQSSPRQKDQQEPRQQLQQPVPPQPSFYEEKTEPPLDLKVSVVFRSDGP